ncbi:prolyl 4-hydroxylase subunit alpha-2-like [Ruditapes philippinarum]|uniref:prolyl 4-hydroxylase subunit alpha-2-like n=1 Tax=Ruditapes philippinarum TaxID=129788 RepID=UPI00295AF9DD|nr:prolyl 4-hydroxylase subunit alpha-2-like [Ruditapes philippinarum]
MIGKIFKIRLLTSLLVLGILSVVLIEECVSMSQFVAKVLERQSGGQGQILDLRQLVYNHERRLNTIKGLVNELDDLSGEEIRDPNFTVHHPLNAYRFIRNHSVIYNQTAMKLLEEVSLYEQEREEMDKITSNLPAVQADDIEETVRGILELQIEYDINTNDMAGGISLGDVRDMMTAQECFDMMVGAYQLQRYDLAWEWMGEALMKTSIGDISTSSDVILNKAFEMSAKPQAQNKLLFCQYISNNHPLLVYRPVKRELLSLDPVIAVYHELFSRDILTKLMKSVTEGQNRQPFRKTVSSKSGVRRIRVNKSTWQKQKDQEKLGVRTVENSTEREIIYRYIEALTSLKSNTFKHLQISGGKFYKDIPYQDNQVIPDSIDTASFRIYVCINRFHVCMYVCMYVCMSVCLYLTDVQMGGATVVHRSWTTLCLLVAGYCSILVQSWVQQ